MSLLAAGSPFLPTFPPLARGSGRHGSRSPVTVAGPHRNFTGFLGPPSPVSAAIMPQPTPAPAVSDLTLSISAGACVALVGESGAGGRDWSGNI